MTDTAEKMHGRLIRVVDMTPAQIGALTGPGVQLVLVDDAHLGTVEITKAGGIRK
jgi:hypothetical protein